MIKIAKVVFKNLNEVGKKAYCYFTDNELLIPDEEVIVETKYGTKVAIFKSYTKENSSEAKLASAWIIDTVKNVKLTSNIQAKKDKKEHLDFIKEKLQERRQALEEIEIFEMLAAKDTQMKGLLEEYKKLKEEI